MVQTNILLDSVDKVKAFVSVAMNTKCDLDITSGRYRVDGKSIMGIFSLDLSKPLTLTLHDTNMAVTTDEDLEDFNDYIVK